MELTRFYKIAIYSLRLISGVFFLVLLWASCCYSADVVFVRSPGGSSAEQEQLEIAARFYGLNLTVITAASAKDDLAVREAVERHETVGVAIAADALAAINEDSLLRALRRTKGDSPAVLILGVALDADPSLLRNWSGGAVSGCRRSEKPLHPQYVFGQVDGFTGQLTNLEIPLPGKDVFYLALSQHSSAQPVASLRNDDQVSPVFIEATVREQKVFVACATTVDGNLTHGEDIVGTFLQIAPAMMFVKFCGGEQAWHSLHQYANLTIDDPWLRPSYGYVDYKGLLQEMDKHNFHTTIAFIPWNFDRSDAGVVSLFRERPDRLSVSVHGDNHDHKEFTSYRDKSLAVQIADVKQSLARMDKFQALTGIHYDKVMVFPHSIAPEETLGALKTYNFLATVNSVNVPQDAAKPADFSFALRPVTLSFAGFPSIARSSVAGPVANSDLAINEFLGNPLFFYGHSEDFASGIAAFDGIADEVNKLGPGTEWRGLGEIVKHLYVVKLRDDSNHDVLSFSSSICLDNVSGRNSIFYVRKREIGGQIPDSLLVNGQKFPYQLQDGYLNFSLMVPKGASRCAAIQYKNDLDLASTGISRNSAVVYLLRMASDFRDIYLSKTALGLAFIRYYNEHELKPAQVLAWAFGLLLVCMYAGYRLRVSVTRRHAVPRAIPHTDC